MMKRIGVDLMAIRRDQASIRTSNVSLGCYFQCKQHSYQLLELCPPICGHHGIDKTGLSPKALALKHSYQLAPTRLTTSPCQGSEQSSSLSRASKRELSTTIDVSQPFQESSNSDTTTVNQIPQNQLLTTLPSHSTNNTKPNSTNSNHKSPPN